MTLQKNRLYFWFNAPEAKRPTHADSGNHRTRVGKIKRQVITNVVGRILGRIIEADPGSKDVLEYRNHDRDVWERNNVTSSVSHMVSRQRDQKYGHPNPHGDEKTHPGCDRPGH